jgi:hypothetical protein
MHLLYLLFIHFRSNGQCYLLDSLRGHVLSVHVLDCITSNVLFTNPDVGDLNLWLVLFFRLDTVLDLHHED